jgi:hypothetical protein
MIGLNAKPWAQKRMYQIDKLDAVVELNGAPQSSAGSPLPVILCDEHFLHLAYLLQSAPEDWDFKKASTFDEMSEDEPCALVRFERPIAHMFGPPSDETFHGHPLAARGLRPYAAFEVKNSSWVRGLERMNSVHPRHSTVAARYSQYRHLIFAFHDATFECVAMGFKASIHRGSVSSVLRSSWPPPQS